MDKIIFKESGHYYDYIGNPINCIPYAKPRREGICPACNNVTWTDVKGDKSTCKLCKAKIFVGNFEDVKGKEPSLRDARKYGLFGSISRFCSYGEMEFELTAWSLNEWTKFVQGCYREDVDEWNRIIQGGTEAHRSRFSDPGSWVHGQIAKAMEGQPFDQSPTIIRALAEISEWEQSLGFSSVFRERGHCDPVWLGLGGMIDSECEEAVWDFKCKFIEKTFEDLKRTGGNNTFLKSVTKQLAGYRHISKGFKKNGYAVLVRVDENHPDTGEICPIEIPEERLEWGLKSIKAAVDAWYIDVEYDPRVMYTQGLCKSMAQIMGETE